MTNREKQVIDTYQVECQLAALQADDSRARGRWLARHDACQEITRRLRNHDDDRKARVRLPNESKGEQATRLARRKRLFPPDTVTNLDKIGHPKRSE